MLAAAARGDRVRAETLGRTIDGALDRPGFGVERALAALARATLEHGSPDRAAEPARDELRADGGDPDLVDWLVTVTGDLILLAQAHTAPPAPPADQVVLDGETGELRAPSRTVPFARRHVLRRLLYCMARRAGEAVSKDDLAQAAWGVRYHPLRHDNALFVNIHRLRALLGGTGVTVVCWEAGYSLSAPSGFRFLAAE
jgi:DNA-binding response OmpR family regulator